MSPVKLTKIRSLVMSCAANSMDTCKLSYAAHGDVNDKGWHTIASESNPAWLDLSFYCETHVLICPSPNISEKLVFSNAHIGKSFLFLICICIIPTTKPETSTFPLIVKIRKWHSIYLDNYNKTCNKIGFSIHLNYKIILFPLGF